MVRISMYNDVCLLYSCQRDEEPLVKEDIDNESGHEQPFEEHYELISNHDNNYDDDSSSLEEQQQSQATMNSTTTNQHYRSCRQEACYYPSDITVDELAGYLDELLYIPRPMSDMAELMYT